MMFTLIEEEVEIKKCFCLGRYSGIPIRDLNQVKECFTVNHTLSSAQIDIS